MVYIMKKLLSTISIIGLFRQNIFYNRRLNGAQHLSNKYYIISYAGLSCKQMKLNLVLLTSKLQVGTIKIVVNAQL